MDKKYIFVKNVTFMSVYTRYRYIFFTQKLHIAMILEDLLGILGSCQKEANENA